MPTPDIKFEVTTDMQAVINNLFSEMETENEQMKASVKSNKAAAEFITILKAVQTECIQIFKDCKTVIPLQNAAMDAKGDDFLEKWRLSKAQVAPKNEMISILVKSGKLNVPPLTDTLKSDLSKSSPQTLAFVEKYHGEVTELKGMIQKLWGKVIANHKKMNDVIKGANELRNQREGNPNGAVPPAPPLSAVAPKPSMPSAPPLNQPAQVHPAPLSSSHGAKNAESQQKAAQASAVKVPYVRASKPLPYPIDRNKR